MEEISKATHGMVLEERRTGSITGVTDIKSFDSKMIVLETSRGMLTVKGQDLHVSRLQLQQGEADIQGKIDSLVYAEGGSYKKKARGSLIKRMFR